MQQKSAIQYTAPDVIDVGERLRKDLGDLRSLSESIKQNGIICPIGVTPEMELIYGQRRLEAAKLADLALIPYIVIETPDDHDRYRSMEMLENTERKDFSIEEKVRIVDQVAPKVQAIKDKIRAARIRGDHAVIDEQHRELEKLLSKDIETVPAKRQILSDLVGLGHRTLQWAREIVNAADQTGSKELAEIVAEMNRTGNVKAAFDRYLKTLPAAPFGKSTPPAEQQTPAFYDDEQEEEFEEVEDTEEDEEPEAEQSESVGKRIGDLIQDSDSHVAPKKEKAARKEPKTEKGESAQAKPPKVTKPRGQARTHRSVAFDEDALRQQHEAFVKKTLRGLEPQHQERAMQILTGGSTAELAASVQMDQEVTDAENAIRRVEKLYEELPPDHQEKFSLMLRDFAANHSAMGQQPEDYLPELPEDHEKALEIVQDEQRVRFRSLKAMEQWNFGSIVPGAVRAFMKTTRRRLLEFERHTEVGADPDKTLFEADADFPEHLATAEFQELFGEWWGERKRRKLSVTPTVKKKQLKLLGTGDVEQATMIVSKAIENSWQGIPDQIWENTLWCDRVPAHADQKLLNKIKSTTPKGSSYRSTEDAARDKANRRSIYREDEE